MNGDFTLLPLAPPFLSHLSLPPLGICMRLPPPSLTPPVPLTLHYLSRHVCLALTFLKPSSQCSFYEQCAPDHRRIGRRYWLRHQLSRTSPPHLLSPVVMSLSVVSGVNPPVCASPVRHHTVKPLSVLHPFGISPLT